METPKLSPAKINPTKLLPGTSISTKKISTKSLQNESISVLKSDLFVIKKQVFKVRDLIQTSTLIKQSELEKKRKSAERKKTEKQEDKLEAKPEKEEGKLKMPSVPKLGFLDRIKNFLFSILLGYITIKLLPHLPKLVGVVSTIGNVMEFMLDLGGNILDKVVTFIDWGYKAIDATRGFIKSVGGEFSLQIFDKFTGAVDGIITATITAALALSAMSGGDGGGGGPGGGKPRVGGKGAGRVDPRAARRYAERFGRDAALKKFGKEGVGKLGGKYARSGVTNLARKGLVGLAGKGGAKMILGFARPLLKRLPIIGALIDFGLSVSLGEDLGRAAFKAIGAGLLGSIGAALGSIVPFAGTFLGGLAGGLLGDMAGGALYDAFFGGKKPQQKNQKVEKKAGGGITRGNKPTGGKIGRTIKKPKRTIRTSPSKVNPGQSIGGEKKIKNIFPEVKLKDKGIKINTYGYMKSSYEKLSSAEAFGGLFALPLKAQLGQEPSKLDYQNAASGLNSWMQRTFSSEIMRTGGVGFAEGGKVEAGMFSNGEDMTKVIEKSLEESISSKVTASINDLKKQLMLKEGEKETGQKKTGPDDGAMDDDGGGGEYSTNAGDYKELLDIIAGVESTSSGGYNAFNTGGSAGGHVAHGSGDASKVPIGGTVKSLTKRTVQEIMDLQAQGKLHATGRYQIIQSTLSGLMKGSYGSTSVKPTDLYDAQTQDELGIALIKGRLKTGANVTNFRSEWIGLAHVPDAKLQAAIDKAKGGKRFKTDGAGRFPSGMNLPSTGVIKDRKWNTGIPLSELKTKNGRGYRVATVVANQFKGFVSDLEATGYKIKTIGGWREAGTGGGTGPADPDYDQNRYSHPYGASIDINADDNSYGPTLKTDMPSNIREIAAKHGLGWGGNWRSVKDAMHFSTTRNEGGNRDFSFFKQTKKFAKGGRVLEPTFATLAEDGRPEFVFDADTTAGLDSMTPNLLEYLNAAKTKPELMNILQSYAPYESGAEQTVVISREMIPIPILMGNPGSGGMIPSSSSSSVNTTYDRQFANA